MKTVMLLLTLLLSSTVFADENCTQEALQAEKIFQEQFIHIPDINYYELTDVNHKFLSGYTEFYYFAKDKCDFAESRSVIIIDPKSNCKVISMRLVSQTSIGRLSGCR